MKRTNHWLSAARAAVVVALLLAGSHSPLTAATLMYVSNFGNGTISAVADNGSVSTFATGLQQPTGLALDRWGNLYAADWGVGAGLVGTIHKITPDGHVSTWISGFGGPGGLAFDGAGNLYVACGGYETTGVAIVRITPGGSASVFATTVQNPNGLAFDRSGNLFVSDYWDHTISKITPDGTVSTFASGFSGRLTGLAFDAVGNLYVVNLDGGVIQKITSGGSISTFATGESWPGDLAFDQSGNLYLSDYTANRVERVGPAGGSVSTFATGFSSPNSIAMVPQGLSIVTPPQSQTAQAGSSVTFSVVAAGTPPLSYQWRKDGANIPGGTSTTLTLTFLGAGNSGAYSVIVWNAYGSVTSATASLAVLTDGANGSQPTQIPVLTPTPPPTGVDSLVVITHGWEPPSGDTSWVNTLADAIRQKLADQGLSNWYVHPHFWTSVLLPLATGSFDGNAYGQSVVTQQHWAHVHLIGHSAGAAFIESAAAAIKAGSPDTTVHCTFLDPYVGLVSEWQDIYGSHADWADCYFTHENLASDPVEGALAPFTDGMLPHVFNVDVGWLNLVDKVGIPCASSTSQSTAPVLDQICSYQAFSTHGYAHDFYLASVLGATPTCSADYGFPLSKEARGWGRRTDYPVGNNTPAVPQAVPCGQQPVVQNPRPLRTDLTYSILDLPNATSSSGVLFFGNGGASLSSDDPAWLAVGLTITNAVNFIQFDGGFTDTNGAQGLLTVYWNTNQIGMVDERAASPGLQTYRFALPGTVTDGLYTLGFRLDAFTNASSITVTNVATGFVGITQPITLDMMRMGTNNAPVLKLTAAPGYNYMVQSSTNLVDWLPTALLVNTNGSVLFADPAVTNGGARFYRAVMP